MFVFSEDNLPKYTRKIAEPLRLLKVLMVNGLTIFARFSLLLGIPDTHFALNSCYAFKHQIVSNSFLAQFLVLFTRQRRIFCRFLTQLLTFLDNICVSVYVEGIELSSVAGIFYVLVFGTLAAFLVGIAETFWHR